MIDAGTAALYAEAVIGRDAEEFLKGDLGRYLLARAREEEQEALEALATVAWWRRRRIQQLQNQVWRARSFQGWVIEIINIGHQAQNELEQRTAVSAE